MVQDHFLTGSKMLMIVAVNPHPGDFDEARQALQYGAIAKEVSARAHVDVYSDMLAAER